jgi:hypothetical protein
MGREISGLPCGMLGELLALTQLGNKSHALNYQMIGSDLTVNVTRNRGACNVWCYESGTKYLAALQGAQRYKVNDQGLQIFY